MTTTLLLVYLGDLFGTLKEVLNIVSFILFVVLIIAPMLYAGLHDDMSDGDIGIFLSVVKKLAIAICSTFMFSVILPSKNLMYIAAGVEAADTVVQSDVTVKAKKALDLYLDSKIKELEKDD